MMKDIRVCIADDQKVVCTSLASLIEKFPRVEMVYYVLDGLELMRSIPEQKPDVILLDLGMPNMNGQEAAVHLALEHPTIKIVVLTSSDDMGSILTMLQRGVHGYVTKSIAASKLESAISSVFGNDYYFDDQALRLIVKYLKKQTTMGDGPNGQHDLLTEKETQIVKLLCEEMDNETIALHLNITSKTLQVHKQNIYKKTGAKGLISLYKFALHTSLIKG